jgi:hypothetical protein
MKREHHKEDVGVSGRIILKRYYKNRIWGTDWVHLAHDRYRWRALVNTVMNHKMRVNS